MNRTKALWAVAPVIILLLLAQTCRADSLVAFLPYANTVDSEAAEYNLVVVDLIQESIVEEMEFDGDVRAVDVVDELGTVYVVIVSQDGSETKIVGLDLQTRQVVFETQLPGDLIDIHVDADQGRLYAADGSAGELIEVDLSSAASWHHPTGGDFFSTQHVRNSRLLMISGSEEAKLWDMDQRSFLDVDLGRYRMPLLAEDGETLIVAHPLLGRVSKLDLGTGELLDIADAGVYWPRPELTESDSRIKFISGVAAGELDFGTGSAMIEFGLSGPIFPSVLTTHKELIVLAEPREFIICPPLIPCDNTTPPASIFVFDRNSGDLLREVEMPNGGVLVNFGRFLSLSASGAPEGGPEPVQVPAMSPWSLGLLVFLLAILAGTRWTK